MTLPRADNADSAEHIAELLQRDQICDRFEEAWCAGQHPRLEDYLADCAEPFRSQLLKELVALEVSYRRQAGQTPLRVEYEARFPDDVATVRAGFDEEWRPDSAAELADTKKQAASKTPPGHLEIRCPSCHTQMQVAVDTSLTELTCSACGSHFNLIAQDRSTQQSPPLSQLGRFELVERLGFGGFGSVWKARDTELDRTVAIKIPRRGAMTTEEQERFLHEARAAAQLRHPNIVSVYEIGREGDSIYIVCDLVRGVTLSDWLTGQQLTSREAAELCAKIADALQHAHEVGVVHRDLKPANIMIDGDGEPHLMDFGLARREAGEATVTCDGQILGTPAYMSPEQAQGQAHQADRRSDVYSLGVILFELLTGELPFRGNARMLMHQVIHDEAPGPRKLNAHVAWDLETITLKCLEKVPERRYQTAGELADELRRYLAGEPIQSRPIGRIAKVWRWSKRKPMAAAFLVLLMFTAIGGTLVAARLATLLAERNKALEAANLEKQKAIQATKSEELARKKAESTADFALDLLNMPGREQEGLKVLSVSTLMRVAAEKVRDRFQEEPAEAARFLVTLSGTLSDLGHHEQALEVATEALHLAVTGYGANAPETLACERIQAYFIRPLNGNEKCLNLLLALVPRVEQYLGQDHPEYFRLCTFIAEVYGSDSDQRALQWADRVAVRVQEVFPEDEPLRREIVRRIARVYRVVSDPRAAEYFREAYRLEQKYDGPVSPTTLGTMLLLPWGTQEYSNEDALALTQQGVQLFREQYGDTSPELLWPLEALTVRCCESGDYILAYAAEQERLAICRLHEENPVSGVLKGYPWMTITGLLEHGETERAMELANGIIDLLAELKGPTDSEVTAARHRQIECLAKSGHPELCNPLIEELLGRWLEQFESTKSELSPASEQVAYQAELLASSAFLASRAAMSSRVVEIIAKWAEEQLEPSHWQTVARESPAAAASILRVAKSLAQCLDWLSEDSRQQIASHVIPNAATCMEIELTCNDHSPAHAAIEEAMTEAAVPIISVLISRGDEETPEDLLKHVVSHAAAAHSQESVSSSSLEQLGEACIGIQRYDLAAIAFRAVTESEPSQPQSWYKAAIAALADDNLEQYGTTCRNMLQHFGRTTKIQEAERIGYACVAAPDASGEPEEVVRIARVAESLWEGGPRLTGAALYRAGQYESALAAFDRARQAGPPGGAWDFAFRAMIQHHLGHDDEAKQALVKSRELVSSITEWPEKIEVAHLIREAETLLQSDQPAAARNE